MTEFQSNDCWSMLQDFARDAVVAADGRTYEREAFEAWMQDSSTPAGRRQRLCATQKIYKNRLYTGVVGMLLRSH